MKQIFAIALALAASHSYAAEAPATEGASAVTEPDSAWSQYLTDVSPGSVSAAGMLGIAGESVTTIENVRNIVVALQGLSSADSDAALGLSITPARTSLLPMSLQSYSQSWLMRLLGSVTISYAQGPATIADVKYERKAYAVDTNWSLRAKDDPLLAVARQLGNCNLFPETPPAREQPHETVEGPAMSAEEASPAETEAVKQAMQNCLKDIHWNRSQVSLAYGEAHIRPDNNSKPEESLGRTLAVDVIYGFDGISAFPTLQQNYGLMLSYRRTEDEPILNTLAAPQTARKDSSLLLARLARGSDSLRFFVEVSDARSRDVTASQRAFKQAIGMDYRVAEGAWLNVRYGKQHKLDGSGTESASMLNLSYSPKALLTHGGM